MSSKLARICFLIVTLSILLFAQNVSNLAEKIAIEALKIAGDICVYTNHNITSEKINT